MENGSPARRLLLVAVDEGARAACVAIARAVAGARVAATGMTDAAGEEPAPLAGVIVAGSGTRVPERQACEDWCRSSGVPVETLALGWFAGADDAVRYGIGLAGDMLLLAKHRLAAAGSGQGPGMGFGRGMGFGWGMGFGASRMKSEVRYEGGSRWLDEEAAHSQVQ